MGEFPRCLVTPSTVGQPPESCASQGIVSGVPSAALLLEPGGSSIFSLVHPAVCCPVLERILRFCSPDLYLLIILLFYDKIGGQCAAVSSGQLGGPFLRGAVAYRWRPISSVG